MGRFTMFMATLFLAVCIAGNVAAGASPMATAPLTAAITSASATIPVSSTSGFDDYGIIAIDNERIAYSTKTVTTFAGTVSQPIVRGSSGTTAADHAAGKLARTVESSIFNSSIDYSLAQLADSSGVMWFINAPVALFNILKTFFTLPISFLGTDLAFLSYLWGIFALGFVVGLLVTTIGGRRV